MKYENKTHEQILREIGDSNTIDETGEKIIKYWCLQLGLNNVVVTCGLVYPHGYGKAFSCNAFAKQLIKELDALKH
jgi:hypothetical protein